MAWHNRARTRYRHGQFDKALADFTKVIELDPKHVEAWYCRGSTYDRLGQLDRAIADYSRAIDLGPKNAGPWDSRAAAYERLGQHDQAIADCSKAIELNPNDALANNALAWLLATCPDSKVRDPVRAVALAKRAVELAPGTGNFWNTQGVAHYRAGDWKAARAALEKSMNLRAGGDAFDFLFLAMAHRKLGNQDEARKCYDQAVRWLEENHKTLKQDPQYAEELRRFRSEAEEVLELKK